MGYRLSQRSTFEFDQHEMLVLRRIEGVPQTSGRQHTCCRRCAATHCPTVERAGAQKKRFHSDSFLFSRAVWSTVNGLPVSSSSSHLIIVTPKLLYDAIVDSATHPTFAMALLREQTDWRTDQGEVPGDYGRLVAS